MPCRQMPGKRHRPGRSDPNGRCWESSPPTAMQATRRAAAAVVCAADCRLDDHTPTSSTSLG
jgi:hypothetical protein